MRKLILLALAAFTLVIVPVALAGQYTYYKVKSGSATVDVSAKEKLDDDYGIDVDRKIGPLKAKRGTVYSSTKSMSVDFTNASKIVIVHDTRGADGTKGGETTLTIKRLTLTVGTKNSFMIGNVTGSSTVPGVTVPSEEMRIFNIEGGRMKKSGAKKYTFKSGKITFNSALTNLLNKLGTPMGKMHASAKIDLGSIGVSVKIK